MTFVRRTLAATAALALPATLLLTGATPAAAATTQTASCTDGGGVKWSARAVWGSTYDDKGTRRTSLNDVGWTTKKSGKVKTDSRIQTYDGTGALIETLSLSEKFDYKSGKTYKARNPRNPATDPSRPEIKLSLGVGGDGFGNCTVTFRQPGQPAGSASDVYEADVLQATSQERVAKSLSALSTDACVDKYAESHAAKLANEKALYHQDIGKILSACGLNTVGENVAYGFNTGDAVTVGWMNSPGHRANILNGKFKLLGVGAAQANDGVWYAVQVFGARP